MNMKKVNSEAKRSLVFLFLTFSHHVCKIDGRNLFDEFAAGSPEPCCKAQAAGTRPHRSYGNSNILLYGMKGFGMGAATISCLFRLM